MVVPRQAHAAGTQPSGSGTSSSPYQIASAANLLWFADAVNGGNNNICAKLTADITLSGTTNDYMIGTKEYGFKGQFDGQGHTIRGVNVTTAKTGKNSYKYAGGLFGCIDVTTSTPAVVKNVTVEGSVNITGLTTHYYIGGVIAIAWGYVNISNVVSKVNVTTTSDGSYSHCGGVLASVEWFEEGNYKNVLTMSNCANYGTLNVACGDICGGVIGYIRNGSITDCLNAGDVTNSVDCYTCGVLGYTNDEDCTMSRCLNVGTITNTINGKKSFSTYYAKNNNIGAISKVYYRIGCTTMSSHNDIPISEADLKSGNLGYTFASNGWGQSLGNNSVNDAYPIPNKADYRVYQTGSNYYNDITSTIPTGSFTTTIETTAQYKSSLTRIGDTKSFTVKPTATVGKYVSTVKHNGTTLTESSISNNTWTYSYNVALNNDFTINIADIGCVTTPNQSTIGTAINLADNIVGSTETFTATPKVGYYIKNATINGSTIAGSGVSGMTNGTKSFTFTVKGSNTVVINTAAIPCTTTLNQSTSTLNLADNQIGSTETFTATPNAGYYITGATINGETIAGTDSGTNGTKSYSFTVKESNTVTIHTAALGYTKPTGSDFTTNLPDALPLGGTVNFTVTPTAGHYITNVTLNGNALTPSATDADGTKHYSFKVTLNNVFTISTATIGYTKPTGSGWDTNLPYNLNNRQLGSTVEFWVKVDDEVCKADVTHNSTLLTPSSTDDDKMKHYSFVVAENNTLSITTTPHNNSNGLCTVCVSTTTPELVGDYYEIINAGQLYWFAKQVSSGNTTINGKLIADIVVNQNVLTADGELNGDGSGFIVWTPIGKDEDNKRFDAIFDGQGHTVSGLYFSDATAVCVGLFGSVGTNSVIKNVGVTDSYFYADKYVAGICGGNDGTVENCFNTATCQVLHWGGGGIVGGNWGTGTIRNCYSKGLMKGNGGGVCYSNDGTVTNCYFLKGTAYAAIRNGMGDAYDWTAERFASGQICWKLNGSTSEGELAWYQNLSGNADAYPVLDSSHGTVYHGYDACTLTYSNHALQPTPEHSYDANGFCTGCGDDYQPATLISEGNYEIANAGQLYWFANQVNSGNTTINGKLTADIVVNHNVLTAAGELKGDGSGFRVWTPIGSVPDGKQFDGLFDGQGHTISGLYINDEEKDAGLFNCISRNGKIKNVGVADSYFNAQSAGGICNTIIGTVENCFNAATCHGDDTGGTSHAGCIAYMNFGIIRNCYNKGLMKGYGPSVCYNNENGTVTNCYYLKGTASIDFAYGSGDATVKTAAQFASGEVTWLLNGSTAEGELAWHQNLSRNADAFPVLDSSHGTVYQGYNVCTLTYSNTSIPTTPAHGYDANGFCTNCGGGYQPATLASEGNYEIANAGQLYWFAEQVNSGNNSINGKLTADIVVNHNVLDADGELNGAGSGFRVWTPIGQNITGKQFVGIFDGQGHTVSGLYFNDDGKSYVGLFGATKNSNIKNVGVTDSYFYANEYVAGICGSFSGTFLENCFNAATCKGKTGSAGGAGGISAWTQAIIRNCYNKGLIKGDGAGVCYDCAYKSVINCYYLEGTAKKGIVYGAGEATVKTAAQFASGEVAWLLNGGTAEGELAWHQNLSRNADAFPVLDSSHGTVYQGYNGCTMTYSNTSIPTTAGHPSFDANGFCTNCGGYQPATLVSEGNYEIANAGQLYWFAEQVISGSPAINGKLTADIVVNHNVLDSVVLDGDGSGFRAWTPIGIDEYGQQFDGIFDGQGHTISGLYINDKSKSYVGLFGSVGTNSKIKNVGVADSYFNAQTVAGICAANLGTVENCFNAAMCQDKSGTGGAAGIVSWNTGSGIMRNCYNKGLIEGYSGGVCYNNAGTITNCYNLQGTAYRDIFTSKDQKLSKTAEQFASGEVTWLLNDGTAESELAWYQKLGDNGDPFPVLTNTGNNTVYRLYADCESETFSYSNNPQHPAPGHHFASGSDVKCDYCDTWKIACFAGQPNGIVRPYPGTLVGDVTLYECRGINGDELHGSALNNKTIAAAHPYIFKAEAGCDTIYFKASNTSVTPPQGRIVLNGMYAYLNPDGYEQQINNNNEFIKFTQNGLRFLNSGQHTFMSGTVLINLSAARAFFNAANPGVALASIGNDLGDVNGDGSVNVIDMNLVINAILAGAGNTSLQGREDVNGDGEINIIDVNAIINIILGNG